MFGHVDKGPKPRCFYTESPLPTYLNHTQPPRRKQPFSTILKHSLSHTLEILLPSTSHATLQPHLPSLPKYTHLTIPPSSLLKDPILQTLHNPTTPPPILISQNNTITISPTGTLTLTLPRDLYQRTGLHGTPAPSHGVKHSKLKEAYTITIDVRAPNFLPGKKGFERVKWAFERVLDEALGRVRFLGLGISGEEREVQVAVDEVGRVRVPGLEEEGEEEGMGEVLEWIGLCLLRSERVKEGDEVDGLFCRYEVPGETGRVEEVVRMRWTGLMSAETVLQIVLAVWRTGGWFGLCVQGFETGTYTVLKTDKKTLVWEYE